MSNPSVEYSNEQKVLMIAKVHEEGSKRYLQDKDYQAYKERSKQVFEKLEANNISMDEYWAHIMR